jgi:hypothetical protein
MTTRSAGIPAGFVFTVSYVAKSSCYIVSQYLLAEKFLERFSYRVLPSVMLAVVQAWWPCQDRWTVDSDLLVLIKIQNTPGVGVQLSCSPFLFPFVP